MIVQAIVNVGLLFAWSCMCLMNTLDDCDLLEKVVKITSIHEHNDVTYIANKSTIQISLCKVCLL